MLADSLVALVAIAHLWFMALESFLWRTPIGLKALGMTPEQAEVTAVLAANQGLYNGFLAAGLFWSLWPQAPAPLALKVFFLGCVIVAGVVGGLTAKWTIFLIQALPALIALALTWFSRAA
ncbi:MAG TPA: DUF1304 domain-containing protein [Stenomitos sp.]